MRMKPDPQLAFRAPEEPESDYRACCWSCFKPRAACICADIVMLPCRIRFCVLQHPVEMRRTIGTARIVSLSLPHCPVFVGATFAGDAGLERFLIEAPGPVYMLYPERGAIEAGDLAQRESHWPDAPPTFVLVDGTWATARKIKNQSPMLDRLERVTLAPRRPSDYRIRKQPKAHCLSTVEATVHLLERLEGSGAPYQPMLDTFARMVDRQIEFRGVRPTRGIRSPAPRQPRTLGDGARPSDTPFA